MKKPHVMAVITGTLSGNPRSLNVLKMVRELVGAEFLCREFDSQEDLLAQYEPCEVVLLFDGKYGANGGPLMPRSTPGSRRGMFPELDAYPYAWETGLGIPVTTVEGSEDRHLPAEAQELTRTFCLNFIDLPAPDPIPAPAANPARYRGRGTHVSILSPRVFRPLAPAPGWRNPGLSD